MREVKMNKNFTIKHSTLHNVQKKDKEILSTAESR